MGAGSFLTAAAGTTIPQSTAERYSWREGTCRCWRQNAGRMRLGELEARALSAAGGFRSPDHSSRATKQRHMMGASTSIRPSAHWIWRPLYCKTTPRPRTLSSPVSSLSTCYSRFKRCIDYGAGYECNDVEAVQRPLCNNKTSSSPLSPPLSRAVRPRLINISNTSNIRPSKSTGNARRRQCTSSFSAVLPYQPAFNPCWVTIKNRNNGNLI